MVRSTCQEIERGPFDLDRDSPVPFSTQLLKHLIEMFREAESIMSPILDLFRVAIDLKSPF